MTESTQNEYDVLHGLRIKGMTGAAEVAAATGVDQALVEQLLDAAVDKSQARKRTGGRVEGYMLTGSGRARHQELRGDHVPTDLGGMEAAYDAFLAPNRQFKTLTTRWQTEANGDVSVVLPDLLDLHEQICKVVTQASATLPRMALYAPRFSAALDAFRSGDTAALAKPMSGSYHDVWMELHEDLILTLGRERTDADE